MNDNQKLLEEWLKHNSPKVYEFRSPKDAKFNSYSKRPKKEKVKKKKSFRTKSSRDITRSAYYERF